MDSQERFLVELGMSVGQATHRLRKSVMWSLADKLDLLLCFRCGNRIENADALSIDHKEPWRGVDSQLFWDLDNIAFSHRTCNTTDRPGRIDGPSGTSWCAGHRAFLPVGNFSKGKRWNGLGVSCKECEAERQRRYAQRNPRFPCPKCKTQMRKECPNCGYSLPMADYMALRRKEGVTY